MAHPTAPNEALVLTTHSRIITVLHEGRESRVTLAGKMQLDRGAPVAGDRVILTPTARDEWRIAEVLPRRSRLERRAVHGRATQVLCANADLAAVVLAPQPLLDFMWAERLLIAAERGGLPGLLVVNKADLIDPEQDLLDRPEYLKSLGIDWLLVSAETGEGMDALRAAMAGRTVTMLGHSGVGKSTLINRLLPGVAAATGDLNRIGYGAHVTSAARYYSGPDFNLIDLAGLREFELTGLITVRDLPEVFVELRDVAHQCRFRDCKHDQEPGCAIRDALETLDPRRVALYQQLRVEALAGEAEQRD